MRIPFDIKYRDKIESGEYKVIYVENSSMEQYPVEILKWDSNSDAGCIIGCLRRNGKDRIYAFDENGEHKVSDEGNRLFIVTPEPEMSEFENGMLRYLQDAANKKDDSEIIESTKEHSPKLLDLAKQHLLQSGELLTQEHHEKLMETLNNDHEKELEKAYKNADEVQRRKGREDALKDLPRWKAINNCCYCSRSYEETYYNETIGQLFHKGKKLSIVDLEKLPGFNDEDYE